MQSLFWLSRKEDPSTGLSVINYRKRNCILICSHGRPSLATIGFVQMLHVQLKKPVNGLSDLNPHRSKLLHEYLYSCSRRRADILVSVPVENLGMRSTQIVGTPQRDDFQPNDEAIIRYLQSPISKFLEYGNTTGKKHELVV